MGRLGVFEEAAGDAVLIDITGGEAETGDDVELVDEDDAAAAAAAAAAAVELAAAAAAAAANRALTV